MSNSKTDLQNLAIKELKNLDPLLQAEKLTGSSYKKDNATSLLGFAIHIEKSREMNKLMDETNDTRFSEKTEDYLDKVKSFNFEQILKDDFQSDGITESLYIFWHKEYSILLSFEEIETVVNFIITGPLMIGKVELMLQNLVVIMVFIGNQIFQKNNLL